MRRFLLLGAWSLFVWAVLASPSPVETQQADVPEPAFLGFDVNAPYVPVYQGRDPFEPLDTFGSTNRVSIGEMEFVGVIQMGDVTLALFNWRGNPSVRYTLRYRKLYGADDRRIDGVVGEITEKEVTLIQGDRKIAYPRTQRRP
jgi:hypothetical protein